MFRPFRLRPIVQNVLQKVKFNARGRVFSSDTTEIEDNNYMKIPIPVYNVNKTQTLENRKARLHYQSRKRGMLENDLLLSTFAKKYLDGFTEEQTMMYDHIINSPSNDWDIFNWIIEKTPTPKEFDNEVMNLLKKHAKNENREILTQPDL